MALALLDVFRDARDDAQPTEPRFQVMVVILVISLFAVSFPGVSTSIPCLRIPHIVFFIGKHFGTGVILATAFIHLLQDSFEALQKRQVEEYFHNIGKHTGLVILASLLSIFLIEYLSTSYVEYLQEEPSPSPTPVSSHSPSPQQSRRSTLKSLPPDPIPAVLAVPETSQLLGSASQQTRAHHAQLPRTDETTPLLRPPRTQSTPHPIPPYTHAIRHGHHAFLPAIVTQDATSLVPIDILTNSPRIIRMRGCTCVVGHPCACPASAVSSHPHAHVSKDLISREPSRSGHKVVAEPLSNLVEVEIRSNQERDGGQGEKPMIGRRRQVVGLLVLQLGIMIHSIVIGLTLAITTGADFTSLTTAVVFHQLFEGLSLGIRIAALPPPLPDGNSDEELGAGNSNKPETPGYRRLAKNLTRAIGGERGEGWLKCSLAILFAITTPTGLGLGIIAFKVGKKKEGIELARMYLVQGLMSAISAGMLIYVSTVEMIAGDFVFGDVEGHGHHGHSHDLPSMEDEERAHPDRTKTPSPHSLSIDQELAPSSGEENSPEAAELNTSHFQHHHHHHHHGKIGKKILAVLSLLAGVSCMVLIGLGE